MPKAYEVIEWEFKDLKYNIFNSSKPDSYINIITRFSTGKNYPHYPHETNEIEIIVNHDKKTKAIHKIHLTFKTDPKDPNKKYERLDSGFEIYSPSTKIDDHKMEEEIKAIVNDFGYFYSKEWRSYLLDNKFLLIEDEPTYYKTQPFNIIFRSIPYRGDNGEKCIATGLILIHKQFKTKILVRAVLKIDDSKKPIQMFWNNYYFITTTNTNTNEEVRVSYFEEVEDEHQKELRERREHRKYLKELEKNSK